MPGTALWRDYVAAHPACSAQEPYVGPFGDSPAMADGLLALVLAGGKRATAGPVTPDDDSVEVGGHWVVLDGSGVPRVVLRTVEVRTGRLDSVDDAFAHDEGEGDLSRGWWLAAHREFTRRVLGLADDADVDGVPTRFARFAAVWPPEHADRGGASELSRR